MLQYWLHLMVFIIYISSFLTVAATKRVRANIIDLVVGDILFCLLFFQFSIKAVATHITSNSRMKTCSNRFANPDFRSQNQYFKCV